MTAMIISDIKFVREPICIKSDDWKETAYAWDVTLKLVDRSMTVEFFTGSGRPNAPETSEVVHCLAMDSCEIQDTYNFEDWAENCGYDTDSRKAERLYNKTVEQAEQFEVFLAGDIDIIDLSDEETVEKFCV